MCRHHYRRRTSLEGNSPLFLLQRLLFFLFDDDIPESNHLSLLDVSFFFYPLPLLSFSTDKELRADKEIQEYELQAQRLTLEEQRKYIEQLDNAFKTAQANVSKLEAELRERSNAVTSSLSSSLNVMNVTPSSSASSSQTVLFQPESSSSLSPVDTHHLPRSSNNSTSGIDSS